MVGARAEEGYWMSWEKDIECEDAQQEEKIKTTEEIHGSEGEHVEDCCHREGCQRWCEMEADDPLCGTPKGSTQKKKEVFI